MNSATFKLYVDDIDYVKTLYDEYYYDQILLGLHLPFENFYNLLKNNKLGDKFDYSKCFILISDFYHYDFDNESKKLITDQFSLCSMETFKNFKSYKEFYFYLESFLKEKGYEI